MKAAKKAMWRRGRDGVKRQREEETVNQLELNQMAQSAKAVRNVLHIQPQGRVGRTTLR